MNQLQLLVGVTPTWSYDVIAQVTKGLHLHVVRELRSALRVPLVIYIERIEFERCARRDCVYLVVTQRLICNMTYLGHS